jgi:hypothetical protein
MHGKGWDRNRPRQRFRSRCSVESVRIMGYRSTRTRIPAGVMEQVIQFIQQISSGEIVITIHDSKIVQVEKRAKTRFKD